MQNEADERIVLRVWFRMVRLCVCNIFVQKWFDERLQWDPVDFANVTSLNVPRDEVWYPDVVISELFVHYELPKIVNFSVWVSTSRSPKRRSSPR